MKANALFLSISSIFPHCHEEMAACVVVTKPFQGLNACCVV